MKIITFILVYIYLFINPAYCQSPVNQIGARALGMSGSCVTFTDIWSQYHNQAGLAYLKGINIGISFQNEFLIKELSTKSIAVALPFNSGVFGLNYYYFGYPKFNESKAGLTFARTLGKRIAAGIQLNYLYTHIDGEYGNNGIASGEIGIISKPIDNLIIGAHLYNVWRSKRANYEDEYLPTIFNVGASYSVYKNSLLCIEFEKDMDMDLVFRTGLEFALLEKLNFRAGVSTNPNVFSFGIGYSLQAIRVDLSFIKHPVLGYSQGISIVYAFKDRI